MPIPTHIHMNVHIHVIYIYIFINIYMYMYLNTHIPIHVHVHVHTFVYIHMHIFIHIRHTSHIHTYMHTYIRIYTAQGSPPLLAWEAAQEAVTLVLRCKLFLKLGVATLRVWKGMKSSAVVLSFCFGVGYESMQLENHIRRRVSATNKDVSRLPKKNSCVRGRVRSIALKGSSRLLQSPNIRKACRPHP